MEILNIVQVSEKGVAFVYLMLAIAAICYAFCLFDDSRVILGSVMAVLSIILVVFTILKFNVPPRTRYEVCFDGDYTVNELIENYEIISQRGDILIVEEKSE